MNKGINSKIVALVVIIALLVVVVLYVSYTNRGPQPKGGEMIRPGAITNATPGEIGQAKSELGRLRGDKPAANPAPKPR